jgi:hypothetical protein
MTNAAPATDNAPEQRDFRRIGLLALSDIASLCAAEPLETGIVHGLISPRSINIAVGDSGLGKTPLFYQLGACVAAGIPFLGNPVRQGRVIYFDYENGLSEILDLCEALKRFLGLDEFPTDFRVRPFTGDATTSVETAVKEFRPVLCIIDSLRGYDSLAETKNDRAVFCVQDLRRIARKYETSFQLLHHTRKPGENGVPALEDAPPMDWLLQACGARALINQTDVRVGLGTTEGVERTLAKQQPTAEVALVMRGFARMRGQFGPVYLAREFDSHGDPAGYRQLRGTELLFNEDQQTAYRQLPNEFSFTEAKRIYGHADQATSDFLQKCRRVGILSRVGRGRYRKVAE